PTAQKLPTDPPSDSVLYLRRTAIAQMQIAETEPRRIGATIDGVLPLADDYPRIGLSASIGAPGVCHIFREADGTGAMTTTRERNADWAIIGFRFGGPETARLRIRVFETFASGPDDTGLVAKDDTGDGLLDEFSLKGLQELKDIRIHVVFD